MAIHMQGTPRWAGFAMHDAFSALMVAIFLEFRQYSPKMGDILRAARARQQATDGFGADAIAAAMICTPRRLSKPPPPRADIPLLAHECDSAAPAQYMGISLGTILRVGRFYFSRADAAAAHISLTRCSFDAGRFRTLISRISQQRREKSNTLSDEFASAGTRDLARMGNA